LHCIFPDFREECGSEQIHEGALTKIHPEPHNLVEEQFISLL